MTTIRHAIRIDAPRERVFASLTDLGELGGWHDGPVNGAVAVGETLTLESRPGLRFGWKTTELVDGTRIVQECVEGPGSTGKTVTFELASDDAGKTVVSLTDGPWDDDDAHLPLCNTHWGRVLVQLKAHAER